MGLLDQELLEDGQGLIELLVIKELVSLVDEAQRGLIYSRRPVDRVQLLQGEGDDRVPVELLDVVFHGRRLVSRSRGRHPPFPRAQPQKGPLAFLVGGRFALGLFVLEQNELDLGLGNGIPGFVG